MAARVWRNQEVLLHPARSGSTKAAVDACHVALMLYGAQDACILIVGSVSNVKTLYSPRLPSEAKAEGLSGLLSSCRLIEGAWTSHEARNKNTN